MVEKKKIKITEKTLTELISEIVIESRKRFINEAPPVMGVEGVSVEDRIGKCQPPKPWKPISAPQMKVGDMVGDFFRVKNFSVNHGQAQTRVYMTNEWNIHVYADEILSQWDGAEPFNFAMTLVRAHGVDMPSFEEWADENPENYEMMPYALMEDLGLGYCGPVREGKRSSCAGGDYLYTSTDDDHSWAMKPKKLVPPSKIGYAGKAGIDFRNYTYQWEIPEELLPEGYDWRSIGRRHTTWDKKKMIILDGKKVINKFFGGDWKKAYPWVFIDLNQTGILGPGAGGVGTAYYGSKDMGTSGKDNITIRQKSENLLSVKSGLEVFRKKYDMDVIDVQLTQDGKPSGRKTRIKGDIEAGISITVSNNPELWQLAKGAQIGKDYGKYTTFRMNAQDGEWARRSCLQKAKGDVALSFTTYKQDRKYSDYTVNNGYWSSNIKTAQMGYFSRNNKDTSSIRVHFYINYNLGIQGEMQRELWLKDTTYNDKGEWVWAKSDINPKNWTIHTWLEVGAVAVLIVGGFFSGGATWYLGALYIAMNTANALLYFAEGNYGMGGLILLFDFIPGGHFARGLGKIFKSSVAPMKAITKVTQSTKILYSGGFKNFNVVLKQLGGNTDNLIIARALAETGESGIKAMKKGIVNMERKKITKEMTEEFVEKLAKDAPDLAKKIKNLGPGAAKEIMEQQRTRMIKYMDNVINGGTLPVIMGEVVVLLTLYDTNMVAQLLHEFLWNTPLKSRKEVWSFSKNLNAKMSKWFAGETWFDEWTDKMIELSPDWMRLEKTGGGMSDIVNSTPCTEEDKEREGEAKSAFAKSTAHLQTKFYPWCVGDYYNWQGKGPALQYCAATSTETFKLDGAKLPQDCKYIEKSHYGIGVKSGFRTPEFNRAMKTDWVDNGWRPGYCVVTTSIENGTADTVVDVIDDALGYEGMYLAIELGWDQLFYAASENFKKLTTSAAGPGELLKIGINKKKYTITSSFNKKLADKLARLNADDYATVLCVMEYYRGLTSAPEFNINESTGQPKLDSTSLPGCLWALKDISVDKLVNPSGS